MKNGCLFSKIPAPKTFADGNPYHRPNDHPGREIGKPVDSHGNADANIKSVKNGQVSNSLVFWKKEY